MESLLAQLLNMTAEEIVEAVVATGQDIWQVVFGRLSEAGKPDMRDQVFALASRAGHIISGPPF